MRRVSQTFTSPKQNSRPLPLHSLHRFPSHSPTSHHALSPAFGQNGVSRSQKYVTARQSNYFMLLPKNINTVKHQLTSVGNTYGYPGRQD